MANYSVKRCIQISCFHSMFECNRTPGYAFSGETHDFWECVYVQQGQICVSADDRIYSMKAGEMIFHKPMELHKYHVEGNKDAKLFIFSYTSCGETNEFFKNKVFELNSDQIMIVENLLTYIQGIETDSNTDNCGCILMAINNSAIKMCTIANFVESLMLNIYETYNISNESDASGAKIFKQAVIYMKDNIHKSLKISEIAEHCCISSTGLKNLFLRYSGLGVHSYFVKIKINKATKMLKSGTSVSETAEKLGFSGQAYFSAAYKRETGKSPSQICISNKSN